MQLLELRPRVTRDGTSDQPVRSLLGSGVQMYQDLLERNEEFLADLSRFFLEG